MKAAARALPPPNGKLPVGVVVVSVALLQPGMAQWLTTAYLTFTIVQDTFVAVLLIQAIVTLLIWHNGNKS